MSDKITLRDPRPTKTVTLPSFPNSKVEIWPSMLTRDTVSLQGVNDDFVRGIRSLPLFIKSWNFTKDDGTTDQPINDETIGLLPNNDVTFLLNEISAFAAEQKKN